MTPSQYLILAYVYNFGRTSSEWIGSLLTQKIIPDYLAKYDQTTQDFVPSIEQYLYQFAIWYYQQHRELPTPQIVTLELQKRHISEQALIQYSQTLDLAKLETCTTVNLDYHIREIKHQYAYWRFVRTVVRYESQIREDPEKINAFIEDLSGFTQTQSELSPIISFKDSAHDRFQRHLKFLATSTSAGLYVGLPPYDKENNGLIPGQSVVVVGRTSIGKSLVLQHIAQHVSFYGGKNVIYASAEVGWSKDFNTVADRFEAMLTTFYSSKDLRWGKIKTEYQSNLEQWFLSFSKMQGDILMIPPERCETMAQVTRECRVLAKKKPIDLIILDYVQCVSADSPQHNWIDKARVVRQLQLLGVELECPVVTASQESRFGYELGDEADAAALTAESEGIAKITDDVIQIRRHTLEPDRLVFYVKKARNDRAGYAFSTRCNFDIPLLGGTWQEELGRSERAKRRANQGVQNRGT